MNDLSSDFLASEEEARLWNEAYKRTGIVPVDPEPEPSLADRTIGVMVHLCVLAAAVVLIVRLFRGLM